MSGIYIMIKATPNERMVVACDDMLLATRYG
jgi:hypothetical protein